MTKVELVDKTAEQASLSKREVERILETIISTVRDALKNGEKVSLTGLGTFVVAERKARMARNPKTGEQVPVPARRVAKFKPGKELKEVLV